MNDVNEGRMRWDGMGLDEMGWQYIYERQEETTQF